MRCSLIGVIFGLLCVCPVNAGFDTFLGIDSSPGATVPVGGNAATARTNFLASLSASVGTEDFEGIASGAVVPLALSFPGTSGSITATLTGGGGNVRSSGGAGRFATSGSQFLETDSGGDFNIEFSDPVAAFGFFGTDIGDFGGNLILTLTNGTTEMVTIDTDTEPNGSLLFWGFRDDTNTYTNIAFTNTGSGDVFGFDDMTVGDPTQVLPPTIPEPNAFIALSMIALCGGARRWRERTSDVV